MTLRFAYGLGLFAATSSPVGPSELSHASARVANSTPIEGRSKGGHTVCAEVHDSLTQLYTQRMFLQRLKDETHAKALPKTISSVRAMERLRSNSEQTRFLAACPSRSRRAASLTRH